MTRIADYLPSIPFFTSAAKEEPKFEQAQHSVFYTAMPHGVTALAVGGMGAVMAASAASTFFAVVGVVMALAGAYAFFGVIGCAVAHSGDPEGYHKNIGKVLVTVMGSAIADMISTVAQVVLVRLLTGDRR